MIRPTSLGILGAALAMAALMTPNVAGAADTVPTFTKDIAPIFQEKCEACHRPDSIAPMSLITYEEARPWARSIRGRVESRSMPPWHIDKTIGIQEFKNDRLLSDGEIDTITRWVDGGAPKGDLKDMPTAKQWPNEQGWNFAAQFGQKEPDLVIRSTPWTQKAGANDTWWKPVVATGITEPRWVRAIELRPAFAEAWNTLGTVQSDQGTAQAAADTAGGRVQVTGTILASARAFVSEFGGSGKLRLIAHSRAERTPLLPNTPGMKEAGFPNLDYGLWGGYVGPVGVPKDVVAKLNVAINTVLREQSLIDLYKRLGLDILGGSPEDLTRLINREYDSYVTLIRDTGVKLE